MNLLELKQVTLRRGDRTLFANFSKNVAAGRVTVIMGPNGAGKSSLLLALMGMIPACGEIVLQGRPLGEYARAEIAREIAWQGDPFLPAARLMEVDGLLDRALGELSSGERQRVELAALMLRNCPLWLLDEPTAHLDLRHQAVCLNMLRRQSAHGRTIVVVLHDIHQAVSIADEVVLLDSEGYIETGTAAAMLTQERLQAVFDVPLNAASLLPDY